MHRTRAAFSAQVKQRWEGLRRVAKKKRPPNLFGGLFFLILIPAATYVPTQLPVQYHRPGEA
jgi:hypothetical protein